jgi:hypothetical protein
MRQERCSIVSKSDEPIGKESGCAGDSFHNLDKGVHVIRIIFNTETHSYETGKNDAGESRD